MSPSDDQTFCDFAASGTAVSQASLRSLPAVAGVLAGACATGWAGAGLAGALAAAGCCDAAFGVSGARGGVTGDAAAGAGAGGVVGAASGAAGFTAAGAAGGAVTAGDFGAAGGLVASAFAATA